MASKHKEYRRQIFHILFGITLVILLNYDIIGTKFLFALFLAGLAISRISAKYKVPVLYWFLKKFDRENVRFPGEGPLFFVIGTIIATGFFQKDIALAAIMILTLGDAFSTIIGKSMGKRKIKPGTNKTIEGFMAGVVMGFLGAGLFVGPVIALLGSVAAMAFEAFEIKIRNTTVDDNLFIPVVASVVMYMGLMI